MEIRDSGSQIKIITDIENIAFVDKEGLTITGEGGLVTIRDSLLNLLVQIAPGEITSPANTGLEDAVCKIDAIIRADDEFTRTESFTVTGATTVSISTKISEGDRIGLEITLVAAQDDESDRAIYVKKALFFRNQGGNVTRQGAVGDIFIIETDATWETDLVANITTQTMDVDFTGAGGQTIEGTVRITQTKLNN